MQSKFFLKGLFSALVLVFLLYLIVVYLPLAFRGDFIPDPYFLKLGFIKIRWYGLLVASGAMVAIIISQKEMIKDRIKASNVDSIFLYIALFTLVGARIGFVIQNLGYYFKNILEILYFWDGGLSIHGAILGGLLGVYTASIVKKENFLKIANIIFPTIFIAGAIGRFGNFFNQEIIGQPTSVFWKMFISEPNRPIGFENVAYFHPVFLYESISFIGFYLILKKKSGNKFGLCYTLIFYSLTRLVVEFWRIDYKPIFGPFDLAQLVSFGIILIGLIVLVVTLTKREK